MGTDGASLSRMQDQLFSHLFGIQELCPWTESNPRESRRRSQRFPIHETTMDDELFRQKKPLSMLASPVKVRITDTDNGRFGRGITKV